MECNLRLNLVRLLLRAAWKAKATPCSLESQKTNMNNFEQKGKTIQEIRANKAILQSEILKLIRKFEEDNEVHVQYVHLTDAHHLSNPLPETVEVRADFMV